jgi:hypothetical protein
MFNILQNHYFIIFSKNYFCIHMSFEFDLNKMMFELPY